MEGEEGWGCQVEVEGGEGGRLSLLGPVAALNLTPNRQEVTDMCSLTKVGALLLQLLKSKTTPFLRIQVFVHGLQDSVNRGWGGEGGLTDAQVGLLSRPAADGETINMMNSARTPVKLL